MPEEVIETPPPEAPPAISEKIPYADHEGNLRENWCDDEELKEHSETLKRFKNVKGLAKSYTQVRTMVGAETIAKPNDNWTEKDWESWHEANGRPAVATDYNFTKPTELPDEYYSEKVAMEAMELFHGLGLNPAQAKTIFDFHNNLEIENLKAIEHNRKLEVQTAKDELVNELGAAYQTREHLGNQAIEIGCKGATPSPEEDEELKKIIIEDYGANPWFTRFLMNIGKHFSEHTSEVVSQVPTPDDLQKQIQEIMAKPEYTHRDKKIRQPLIDKVNRLYEQINKSKGIT